MGYYIYCANNFELRRHSFVLRINENAEDLMVYEVSVP